MHLRYPKRGHRAEREAAPLGGIKSPDYGSDYAADECRVIDGGEACRLLKARYDPQDRLGDLYGKWLLRQR